MIQTDSRRSGTPVGITIAVGVLGIIAAALIAGAIPAVHPGWRFAVIAIAVGLFAAVSLDELALGAVALMAFAVSNGFLEDRFGQLTWHGSEDVWRLLLLIMSGAFGLALGEAYRYVGLLRTRRKSGAVVSHEVHPV